MGRLDRAAELVLRAAIVAIAIGLMLFPDPLPLADEAVIGLSTWLIQREIDFDNNE